MVAKHRPALAASALILAVASLTGCAGEDRRLVADQESCRNMGHAAGTPEFKQCMNDLNERRCAVQQRTKAGPGSHVATTDCTRLP
jgi:hypothetical protein